MTLFVLLHLFQHLPFSPSLLLLVALAIVLIILAIHLAPTLKGSSSKGTRLPPSPSKLPFIGNLHQLGSLPHRSLRTLSDKHGPIMLLHLGRSQMLVVSSPDMAREIMKTQDHIFANRPSLKVPKQLLYNGLDVAFAPYGEYWRQVRKISVLHLLSSRRVQSYQSVREEEVAFMIDKISRSSSSGSIDVSEALNSLAKGVISRSVVGRCLRDERWNEFISQLIEESSTMIGAFHVGDYFPSLAWLSTLSGLDARVRKAFKKTDVILGEIIENHANRSRDDGRGNDDFIDILLSLEKDPSMDVPFNKENIKAITKDLFGAGTDSTYITMEWAMAELARNPKAMKKLRDEIRRTAADSRAMVTEEDLVEMSYLKAVIKESMRLHPTGPLLVPRESMEDTQIQGYEIPKKARVVVNVYAIGRDPKVWDDPEEFRPERFIDSHADFMGNDFQFTPFGAGRRVCPGIQFAMSLVELALANLVHRFDWELPEGMKGEDLDMAEAPGLTARKKTHLQLVAKPCVD